MGMCSPACAVCAGGVGATGSIRTIAATVLSNIPPDEGFCQVAVKGRRRAEG